MDGQIPPIVVNPPPVPLPLRATPIDSRGDSIQRSSSYLTSQLFRTTSGAGLQQSAASAARYPSSEKFEIFESIVRSRVANGG